jgi:hypothetical protein
MRMLASTLLNTNQSQLKADSNKRMGMKMNSIKCGCIKFMEAVLTPTNPIEFYINPSRIPSISTIGE